MFKDRMVNDADMYKFDEFRTAVTKKFFDDCGGMMAVEERPLLYCSFLQVCVGKVCVGGEGVYACVEITFQQ